MYVCMYEDVCLELRSVKTKKRDTSAQSSKSRFKPNVTRVSGEHSFAVILSTVKVSVEINRIIRRCLVERVATVNATFNFKVSGRYDVYSVVPIDLNGIIKKWKIKGLLFHDRIYKEQVENSISYWLA